MRYRTLSLITILVFAVATPHRTFGTTALRQPADADKNGPAFETKVKFTFTAKFTPTESRAVLLTAAYINLHNVAGIDWQIGFAPFTLGPVGLLFDADPVTGGHVKADLAVGNFTLTGLVIRGGKPSPAPDVLWAFRAGSTVGGVAIGLNYLGEVAAGAWSYGWAGDASLTMVPGVSLTVEYASFTPAGGAAATAYQAIAAFDLATLLGVQAWSPSLELAYRNADALFIDIPPAFTNADDFRGWSAKLGLMPTPSLEAAITYESGTDISSGDEWNGVSVEFVFALAANTELTLKYGRVTIGGVEDKNEYEVKLTYEFN